MNMVEVIVERAVTEAWGGRLTRYSKLADIEIAELACRRAVREVLGLVTTLCDRYDNEQALDTDWLIDSIRALAATLDKGENS